MLSDAPKCRPLLHVCPVVSVTGQLSKTFHAEILLIEGRPAAKLSGVTCFLQQRLQLLSSQQ